MFFALGRGVKKSVHVVPLKEIFRRRGALWFRVKGFDNNQLHLHPGGEDAFDKHAGLLSRIDIFFNLRQSHPVSYTHLDVYKRQVKETSSVNDFTMLDHAQALDETTVVFHMTRAFSIWPYTMAVVGIVPEHAYDPAAYGSNPIGSGRYILKQWDRGQQVILEANPDYYGEAPNIQRVTVLFMEEDAAFLAAQAGQVDVAYTSATYSDQQVEGYSLAAYASVDNRGFNLPAVPAGETNENGVAIGNDFTSDVLVRRALNIGVDRQEMIDNVLNGYGSPAYSVCDQMPWYNPASEVEYLSLIHIWECPKC